MNNRFVSLLMTSCLCFGGVTPSLKAQETKKPNILFIIMDDVGVDQLRTFGYGGLTPPSTPVLDMVSQHGVRFRNVWSMPECSPSRAMFFEGRYPQRTNILTAILSTDLANSQVSPYEMTTPKILREVNYKSALFGKYHLAGPDNNPYGNGTPISNGFDYFDGFLEGAPHPIDTTAGGAKTTDDSNPSLPVGPYSCGFVPNKTDDSSNGADAGACYFADDRGCKVITTQTASTPGRSCLEQGGVFVPNETGCRVTPPSTARFDLANGYYVFNLVTNDRQKGTVYKYPLTDARARMYSPIETTDAAVNWIKSQPAGQSWMATASYALIHAPYQQAPQSLTPSAPDLSGVNCTGGLGPTRQLSNQMVEALDSEIGRLLVQSGVATRGTDGSIQYDPAASNTMVVIIGDNGTYAPSVKAPFDLQHAKGFVNQTGVWVPLIVAGPLVNTPDRNVEHMVNVADLFQLFGEIAGVDVRKAVPASHVIDSASMLPYLTNPLQPSIRNTNFTQTGINITAGLQRPGPCVIPTLGGNNTCVQIFPQAGLCRQEGGTWYGQGTDQGKAFNSCCDLKASGEVPGMQILPLAQAAVRNARYKLISVTSDYCDTDLAPLQLYTIDQAPGTPLIDYPARNIITDNTTPTNGLNAEQLANFTALKAELDSTFASFSQTCPGDGNQDGVVDSLDISSWGHFRNTGSSWYDFNFDGVTNQVDLSVVRSMFGKTCPPR